MLIKNKTGQEKERAYGVEVDSYFWVGCCYFVLGRARKKKNKMKTSASPGAGQRVCPLFFSSIGINNKNYPYG